MYGLVTRLTLRHLMAMIPYQFERVREKGRFASPVDFVKAIIPFTFVHSWIKPPVFWKVSQLPHPNSLLDISVFLPLLIIPLLIKRLIRLLLLFRPLFLNLAVPSRFSTNPWSGRVTTRIHHLSIIPFWKNPIHMFFSSPPILLRPRMIPSS